MAKDHLAIINNCRDKITALDQEIFTLIKKRELLSAQIGEAKRGLNIPDHDRTREKAVFDNALSLAKTLDLPETLATSLQQLIINVSLSRQERDRIKNNSSEKPLKCVVIGGSGRMGSWFCRFLAESGHRISVIDTKKPAFTEDYYTHIDNNIIHNNLIIIATPIRASIDIISKLKNINLNNNIIFDISSVKTPVYKSLCELRDKGALVSSIHPMFGATVELLFGKHIILTTLGVPEADAMAKRLFKSTSLNILEMSIDEHDIIMSYLLSLSHLLHIIFVLTLQQSALAISSLSHLASPTFSHLLSQALKVFEENPHLYYEIQALNPHNKKSYEALSEMLNTMLEAITQKKEHDFVAMMNAGYEYLTRIS
jgi:chorismate mutase/prephenate dehydrogenase